MMQIEVGDLIRYKTELKTNFGIVIKIETDSEAYEDGFDLYHILWLTTGKSPWYTLDELSQSKFERLS